MKKNLLVCFLVMLLLAMVLPVSLFCQEEEEPEEEPEPPPDDDRPNPIAWKQLEKMDMLRNLKLRKVLNGQAWVFELRNVKLALEKAKIRQKVIVEYISLEGVTYPLGTYSPAMRKSKRVKSKLNKKLINPQPEPPRFHTIPFQKQVPVSAGIKKADIKRKGKALLVFKDGKGKVKAVVELSMGPIPKRELRIHNKMKKRNNQ
jgi:hypothetical protein